MSAYLSPGNVALDDRRYGIYDVQSSREPSREIQPSRMPAMDDAVLRRMHNAQGDLISSIDVDTFKLPSLTPPVSLFVPR